MKNIFSLVLTTSSALVLIALSFGCAAWNQAKVEERYGPPVRKEIVDDKTIYQYHYFGRGQKCLDFTFDKAGNLIGKRQYYGERCNSQQIDSWLTISGAEPPTIDVTGKWHDTQGSGLIGWGEGYLRQEKNKISGTIGGYDIKGVVSGKKVYLVFLSGGTVYYRARLEMSQDLLIGNFFRENDTKGYSMSLEKMVRATK
jgi:hypothetical protein